jgi:hypothetical protein
MDDLDRAWLAGLLEGEGCFYVGRGGKQTRPNPRIQLSMQDPDVVRRAAAIVGSGYTYDYEPKPPSRRRTFVWRTSGQSAIDLMRELLPLMGQRRAAKIEAIIAAWNAMPHLADPQARRHGTDGRFVPF